MLGRNKTSSATESAGTERLLSDIVGIPSPVPGWQTWLQLIAAFATIVAVLSGGIKLIAVSDQTFATVLAIGLIFFLFFQVYSAQRFQRQVKRRSRYALAAKPLHLAVHGIRDATDRVPTQGADDASGVRRDLGQALGQLAQAVTLVTGSPARACIKTLAISERPANLAQHAELICQTLCRDIYTGNKANETEHSVQASTAFSSLALAEQRRDFNWWYSNDLESVAYYLNPSIPPGGTAEDLAYSSTAVWPIQKTAEDSNFPNIVGFLCVDTPETNVFEERFDFHLGACVADAAYALLELLRMAKVGPIIDLSTGKLVNEPAQPESLPAESAQPSVVSQHALEAAPNLPAVPDDDSGAK